MGGSKPTSIPFPTFNLNNPAATPHLASVGRCRINPKSYAESCEEYNAIISKNMDQSQVKVDVDDADLKSTNKKLKKKYMKQGVGMAQSYLYDNLGLDASSIDIEILVDASDIIQSDGCVAACFLDAGCDKIAITGGESVNDILEAVNIAGVPRDRVVVHLDYFDVLDLMRNSEKNDLFPIIFSMANTISVDMSAKSDNTTELSTAFMIELAKSAAGADNNVTDVNIVLQIPSTVDSCEYFVAVISQFCGDKETPLGTVSLIDPTPTQMGMCYAACIRTDRDDGLYTTVVCTRSGEALGLVYSSKESIVAALECGRGVYYSRSRNGLWRKGDTSGHYQTLHRIDVDCDGDALRFTVTQRGDDCAAFCHLNTLTCWGEPLGVRHLEGVLKSRLRDAPAGSYTKRLFDDSELLRDKLVEEAQELSEADDKQHVAEELADVLYFAMVQAAKFGVSIDDAVSELDKRARKVTRRQGDSKTFRIEAGNAILQKK